MSGRQRVVAGNWKMHLGPPEVRAYFRDLVLPDPITCRVVVFPAALSFEAARASPDRDPRVELGVQNVHWEDAGAFTGEVSVPMARDAGAVVVLIGHSERRHVFGESDEDVARKVAAVCRHGLEPVICVGETLEERRADRVEEVILRQLEAALASVPAGAPFQLAYEPVWAIGTGETATPDDAAAAHGALRARLERALGASIARTVPILYGGSVKPANAAELMAARDVDGVLVGGASLDPVSFAGIVAAS
jgi:triosephosphate isomerase (TIM)